MSTTPYHRCIALVLLDDQIDALKRERAKSVLARDQLNTRKNDMISRLERERKKLHDVIKQLSLSELELAALEQRMVTTKKRFDVTSDAREYLALEQEIKKLEHDCSVAEDAIVQLWSDREGVEKQLHVLEPEVAIAQTALNEQSSLIEESLRVSEEQEAVLAAQRNGMVSRVPVEWLSGYASLRSNIARPVVALTGPQCPACGTKVPAGDQDAVHRHVWVACQQCRRLLYDPTAIHELESE